MHVEIRPPCEAETMGAEAIHFRVSSVALWVLVCEEGTPKYFLAVQQQDKPGFPWGAPAGKVEADDATPLHAGLRELKQETGLVAQVNDVRYLNWYWERYGAEKGSLIYGTLLDAKHIELLNSETLADGTILYDPPPGVDRTEIRRLALIPLSLAFQKNVLNDNPYHFLPTYKGLIELRHRGFVSGRFQFEIDPGLFDD